MDRPLAEIRREPRSDTDTLDDDPELVRRIRNEIRERGRITFARFMERALYEPGHGYYRRPDPGPGRQGDFITAPETDAIFGAAIGRLLEQAWEALGSPDPFVVTEPGAGTGALALGLLQALRTTRSPLSDAIRVRPVDIEQARVAAFERRLAEAGFADKVIAPDDGAATPPAEIGAVVGNEVVDALPVHRVVARAPRLLERYVTLDPDGSFVEVDDEPSTPALAERLVADGVTLADGQVAEVCLAVDAWVRDAVAHLERGFLVVVDYGREPADLYSAERPTGTLRAFVRHTVHGDPYRNVGRQDLTADVDLAALRRAANAAGLTPVGETRQADLLVAADVGEVVRHRLHGPSADLADALALRSALARLLDPSGMGGFAVLCWGRGVPPETRLPILEARVRPNDGRG
ncbi:MAG: class I SAM-dependent methyltransferase [Chloroflexota bacterium]